MIRALCIASLAAGLAPPLATNNKRRVAARATLEAEEWDATDDAATLKERREAFRTESWRKRPLLVRNAVAAKALRAAGDVDDVAGLAEDAVEADPDDWDAWLRIYKEIERGREHKFGEAQLLYRFAGPFRDQALRHTLAFGIGINLVLRGHAPEAATTIAFNVLAALLLSSKLVLTFLIGRGITCVSGEGSESGRATQRLWTTHPSVGRYRGRVLDVHVRAAPARLARFPCLARRASRRQAGSFREFRRSYGQRV